ncbi:MAG: PRTRC system protein B [Chitinophagaceae bacterium]|nr:PRTRC system protein B [Chitinophagaceae bacterium]
MNDRTDLLLSEYKPSVVIMVYKGGHNKYYLESHDVNGRGEILAGKPLLQETLQAVVDVFFDERKNRTAIGGIMPDNLLHFCHLPGGNYRMIWFRPEEQRVIHHAESLKIKTGITSVPALIYRVSGGDLDVFALKANKRPDEKTKLFVAPFFNVSNDGGVCLGNAKVEKPKVLTFSNLIKYWEDLFWLSEFSHVNGNEKVKSGDLTKIWRSLVGAKQKFPKEELMPSEVTMKNIIA